MSGRYRKYLRQKDGFTLIELIVVCLLIGLLLSLSVPSMRSSLFSDPLKGAARRTIGLVNGVRELAARQQKPYLLHISHAENQIWYEEDGINTDDQEKDRQLTLPETVRISEVKVAGNELSRMDDTVVWISRKGLMEEVTLRLEDDSGAGLVLGFHPFTDNVTITDNRKSFNN